MPVLGRAPALTVGQNGEITGVIPENSPNGQPPFMLNMRSGNNFMPMFYVQKDTRNQEADKPKGYGAGTRILYTINTCERKPLPDIIPVIAIWTDGSNGGYPMNASLIEGAVDPQLTYDSKTGRYHLYYWVNAWSPPGDPVLPPGSPPSTLSMEEDTLFNSVKPPNPTTEDSNYRTPNSSVKYPFARSYLGLRDLPEWYAPGLAPVQFETDSFATLFPTAAPSQEKLGPFNLGRFWIAPWSDGHLYRFGKNFDPIPAPSISPPLPLAPPGSPPPPPPVVPVNSVNFLDQFQYASIPQQPIQQEVAIALYHFRHGTPLTPTQLATLLEYQLLPRRLMNLARTTRVLMHTTGHLYVLRKQNDLEVPTASVGAAIPVQNTNTMEDALPYLVVESPQPVMAMPKGSNKVMVGRSKWTSYISGEDTYILAGLNFRYPAAGTVSLTCGNPQVDFQIHDPCDNLDAWRRGVSLPEADSPQMPQQLPEKTLLFPGVPSFTLVGLMNDMSVWGY